MHRSNNGIQETGRDQARMLFKMKKKGGLEIILLRSGGPQIGQLLSLLQLPTARPGKRIGFQLDQLTDLAMVLWAAELIGGSGTLQLEAEGRAGSSLSAAIDLHQLKPNHEIISFDWIAVLMARTFSQKAEVTLPKYARQLRSSSFIIFQSSWNHQTPKSFWPLHLRGTNELQWVQLELLTQGLSPKQLQLKEYLPSHFSLPSVACSVGQWDADFLLQTFLQSSDLQAKQHCFDFHSVFEREREAGQHKATAKSSQAALSLQKQFNGQISLTYPCQPSALHAVQSLLPSCVSFLTWRLNRESDQETDPGLGRKTTKNKKKMFGVLDSSEFPVPGQGQPHHSRQQKQHGRPASLLSTLHGETTASVSSMLLSCQVAVKESSSARN